MAQEVQRQRITQVIGPRESVGVWAADLWRYRATLVALCAGGPVRPSPPASLLNVSRATLLAVEVLKSGMPQEVAHIL